MEDVVDQAPAASSRPRTARTAETTKDAASEIPKKSTSTPQSSQDVFPTQASEDSPLTPPPAPAAVEKPAASFLSSPFGYPLLSVLLFSCLLDVLLWSAVATPLLVVASLHHSRLLALHWLVPVLQTALVLCAAGVASAVVLSTAATLSSRRGVSAFLALHPVVAAAQFTLALALTLGYAKMFNDKLGECDGGGGTSGDFDPRVLPFLGPPGETVPACIDHASHNDVLVQSAVGAGMAGVAILLRGGLWFMAFRYRQIALQIQ